MKKLKIPADLRARTWEWLERQLYSPERIARNHQAGARIVDAQLRREQRKRRR